MFNRVKERLEHLYGKLTGYEIDKGIDSLEKALLDSGYKPYPEKLPGHIRPILMKEEVGVHFNGIEVGVKCCIMEIEIPSLSKPVEKYDPFFSLVYCGNMIWVVRKFPPPVVNVLEGTGYVLPIRDERTAIETVKTEVVLTQDMLENAGILKR